MVKVIISDVKTICYDVNDSWHTIGYIVDNISHTANVVITDKKTQKRDTIATFSLDKIIGISDNGPESFADILFERWNFPN